MRRWWLAAAGASRRLLAASSSPSASAAASRRLPVVAPPVVTCKPGPLSGGCLRRPPAIRFPATSTGSLLLMVQVRHYAKKENKRSRAPRTPRTSKVKKYKMKTPSSFKLRFRPMHDGRIRRWKAGGHHLKHAKSKEAIRRFRRPAVVHLAYAKVMKKLNFCN